MADIKTISETEYTGWEEVYSIDFSDAGNSGALVRGDTYDDWGLHFTPSHWPHQYSMAEMISRIQEAGARFVAQMSMSWHYGDHENGLGLFGAWERIWTDDLLGPAPCTDVGVAQQRVADGSLRRWPIDGRPYLTYSGCMCNPHWLAIVKSMVKKAIALGVDGFNVHHNFENFTSLRPFPDGPSDMRGEDF